MLARIRRWSRSSFPLAAPWILVPVAAFAAEVELVEQVTVTATATELPSGRSAIPTQVITREELDSLSTTDVEAALAAVPGVVLRRNAQFRLGATVLSLDGAEPDQVAVLLDGRPFLGGVDGVVDLRDIPTGNVERIEIVRGPSSALYGSQAMAGVINIITNDGEGGPVADVTAAAGSFGQGLVKAAHAGRVGKAKYFVSVQRASEQPEGEWGDFSTQLDPQDRQARDHAFVRVELPWEHSRLNVSANYLEEVNPSSLDRNPSGELRWSRDFDSGAGLEIGASLYSYFRSNSTAGLEEQRDYDDQRAEVRYRRAWMREPSRTNQLFTAGWKLRREVLDSPVIRGETGIPGLTRAPISAQVSQQSVWLQDEAFLGERWSLVASLSVDDHERYRAEASPRLAVAWLPRAHTRIGASWGEGFKAPDLLQLYDRDVNVFGPSSGYQIVGNPDLRAETSRGFTLNASADGRWLSGFVHAAAQHYRDLITTELAALAPLTFRYVNVGDAHTRSIDLGAKLDLATRLGIERNHGLDLSLNLAWLQATGSSTLPSDDGNVLPYRPAFTFSPILRYVQRSWGSQITVGANRHGDQYTRMDNLETIEAHWLVHFKVVQRLWHGLSAFVEGTNVTDAQPSPEVPLHTVGRAGYLAGLTYSLTR